MEIRRTTAVAVAAMTLAGATGTAAPLRDKAFTGAAVGRPEIVATFYGPVPVGVAVSSDRRIFVSFPRTMDVGPQTLGELKNGRIMPFPSATVNRLDQKRPTERLLSVQGITVDDQNRLWALDTGKIRTDPIKPGTGAAKLVCISLETNKITRVIAFPSGTAGPNAYLNDVRIDPFIGTEGTAFITDSSETGPNGIVVVDLATGNSFRRLDNHPSVRATPKFTATVEGQPLLIRKPGMPPSHDKTGVDGLALSGDGQQLYYCPNAGRTLYQVSTKALADNGQETSAVVATVKPLGDKGFASDGIEADASGRLFLTDYEHDALRMRLAGGGYQTIARSPAMIWPDSISIARDGYLYYTSNQLNRRTQFHNGKDLRRKPYLLYRIPVAGAQPQSVAWRGMRQRQAKGEVR
ncbi:MAG: gluconolaconase [Cytophagales bacterium]|nr:gluconolaconase [Armatimonadota bacterium]